MFSDFLHIRYLPRQSSQRRFRSDLGYDQTKARGRGHDTLAIASISTGQRAIATAEVTAERTCLPSASSRYRRADGIQALHALSLKPDHSDGADKEGEITVHLKGKEPIRLTQGRSIYFDIGIGHAFGSGSQRDPTVAGVCWKQG
jgi:hypothetical protein